MGKMFSFFRRVKREGEENREKYVNAQSLSSLENGGNFVILNASAHEHQNEYLALTFERGHNNRNCVTLARWNRDYDDPDKIFRVELSIDYGNYCVVSSFQERKPRLQWTIGDKGDLQMKAYEGKGDARLRPQGQHWKFRFEERSPPGSKMYRIVSLDDDLDGIDSLALVGSPKDEVPKLGFKRRMDEDLTQFWYLSRHSNLD